MHAEISIQIQHTLTEINIDRNLPRRILFSPVSIYLEIFLIVSLSKKSGVNAID